MNEQTIHIPAVADDSQAIAQPLLDGRLGIDYPAGWWPATPQAKGYEAAGFSWVQVRTPPGRVLVRPRAVAVHAGALRRALDATGLALVVHAPEDLSAGTPAHDRAFVGLWLYAAEAGARYVVYHGAQFPIGDPYVRVQDRLLAERCSLSRLVRRAQALDVTLAIENLAPVYPGPERASHAPESLQELIHYLDSERVGMCFDVGHAHIAAELAGCRVTDLLEPVLESVVLFHVHDNFGGRLAGEPRLAVDPLKLDLHLAPGAGTVPWPELAPLLGSSGAPLQLEVHPSHRPAPAGLAVTTAQILTT
jgi:sugar phosphate isomerase/epimerase